MCRCMSEGMYSVILKDDSCEQGDWLWPYVNTAGVSF
jgi:hypothetical protein